MLAIRYIGQLQNQSQHLYIGKYCEQYTGAIIHLLMHALGLYHEDQRYDRDAYLHVHTQNILVYVYY